MEHLPDHPLDAAVTPWASERGVSLIEITFAGAILITAMVGIMGAIPTTLKITENEGHLSARTAEYAQDKMEQLLALAYSDAVSDTTQSPTVGSGGLGLTVGGSADSAAPVASYVDFLRADGTPMCPCTGTAGPSGWYYERVWQVSQAGTNLKQLTVTATVANSMAQAIVPKTTLTTYRSKVGNE
jgi:hypothetical protein